MLNVERGEFDLPLAREKLGEMKTILDRWVIWLLINCQLFVWFTQSIKKQNFDLSQGKSMNVTSLSSMDPAARSCLRSSAVNLVEAKNVSEKTFAVDGKTYRWKIAPMT